MVRRTSQQVSDNAGTEPSTPFSLSCQRGETKYKWIVKGEGVAR